MNYSDSDSTIQMRVLTWKLSVYHPVLYLKILVSKLEAAHSGWV